MQTTLGSLQDVNAPLKLVMGGNHDFTLDDAALASKLAEADRIAGHPLDRGLTGRTFGGHGEARKLWADARDGKSGIVFLDEGNYSFELANGAHLGVYASPHTPSGDGGSSSAGWAFAYQQDGHAFDIHPDTSVVMTHGPPHGILDRTPERKRVGCRALFGAVARLRPVMHCFGHVHCGWGAKLVAWKPTASEVPSHFTDIDNGASVVVDSLAGLRSREADEGTARPAGAEGIRETSLCDVDEGEPGRARTLFVNASIMGEDGEGSQVRWVVDLMLPPRET